jgi:hypothetical protein
MALCLFRLKGVGRGRRLITYIDTKAKDCHQKILTCKETLRQVFIRVYRLEIQSVMLVFLTQLCELSGSTPPPLLCVNKNTVYTYTVFKRGWVVGVLDLRQIYPCRKVPSQINYFR